MSPIRQIYIFFFSKILLVLMWNVFRRFLESAFNSIIFSSSKCFVAIKKINNLSECSQMNIKQTNPVPCFCYFCRMQSYFAMEAENICILIQCTMQLTCQNICYSSVRFDWYNEKTIFFIVVGSWNYFLINPMYLLRPNKSHRLNDKWPIFTHPWTRQMHTDTNLNAIYLPNLKQLNSYSDLLSVA